MTSAHSARALANNPSLNPLELLRKADLMSREFAPKERAAILQDLAAAAADIDPMQAKAWANQLLHISFELPLGHFRALIQKNTLCTMAQIDADRAAALWKLQDAPEIWATGDVLVEDLRSEGTAILFPALWKEDGSKSIATVQMIADWLGRTGQYPYGPVAEVMRKLIATDHEAVQSFYTAGIHYVPNGQRFETTNRHFVSFIVNTRNLVGREPLRKALAAAVLFLENATTDNQATSCTLKGSCNWPVQDLLSELLPTIRDVDCELAVRLIEKYPGLLDVTNSSPDPIRRNIVSPPDNELPATQEAMDEIRLYEVQAMVTTDRKKATKVALAIHDLALQSAALASLAPIFVEGPEEEIVTWINSVSRCLESLKSADPKLRLMVNLCQNYLSRGRFAEGIITMHQAFALGELLFARMEVNSAVLSGRAEAFDALSDLVDVAASKLPSPDALVNEIGCVRNQLLQAKMLVIAATALHKGRG